MGARGGELPDGVADLPAAVGDATAVLLLAPDGERAGDAACSALLTPGDGEPRLLAVAVDEAVDERLESWGRHGADPTSRQTHVVAVGETARSAASAARGGGDTLRPSPSLTVETVAEAGDLAAVGVAVDEWLEAQSSAGQPLSVCVSSLTALLDAVEVRNAFRFLHLLGGRLAAADARAHVHLDPEAVPEETVRTLEPVFDAVVESGADGWSVTRR